jgi:hypothetical protein
VRDEESVPESTVRAPLAFGHDFSRVPTHSPAGPELISLPGAHAPAAGANRPGRSLPFLDAIQRSFGHHDISNVRAHTDRGAAAKSLAMGAEAFTRGSEVTFARAPSLHTAAHEAAHVVQQRAGAQVVGGVGREGDAYERHADGVAERVVSGRSSETLLDDTPGAVAPRSYAARGIDAGQRLSAAPPTPVLQMQRIPPNVRALLTAIAGGNGPNFAANAAGVQRMIDLARAELSAAERATVATNRRGGLTQAQFDALPYRERLYRTAEAIVALFPAKEHGDPKLIDTGPRPLSPDTGNLTTVVNAADGIFADIASGARDAWLTDVFGAANIVTAKAKYAAGRTAMNTLHASGGIVTDRSGYSEEVFLGGLTDPPGTVGQKIRVEKDVIDNPTGNGSVVTLLHESMHAGNSDVSDDIYAGAGGFTTQADAQKLTNSAHFEVVPWRILDPTSTGAYSVTGSSPLTFQPFVPAGTTVGGVTAPARTRAEEGAVAAYDRMREAWTIGLNLHPLYVQLYRTPTDWTVPQPGFGGKRFDNSLPFWSKVQKLTIHLKTAINPASALESERPVSQTDVALSEALTRKLALGMGVLEPLGTQAQILAFEATNSTASERSTAFPGGVHNNANTERDFLLRLTVRHPGVGPLTGSVARDVRVVRELGTLNWGDVLDPRSPASFPFS